MKPKITEAQFQKQVIQYAKLQGWRVAHFRTSMNSRGQWMTAVQAHGAGFPDLVMVREGRLIFAELKRDERQRQKMPDNQLAWLSALQGVIAVEVYVWTPENWIEIESVLSRS